MTASEKIQRSLERLPPSYQAEALDFIDYLQAKAAQQETEHWSAISIASALRGMEEEAPAYGAADLKVLFP